MNTKALPRLVLSDYLEIPSTICGLQLCWQRQTPVMSTIYPPDADTLLAMSNSIAEQVRKYTDMQRACNGSSSDFFPQQGQKLQEQAEAVARECSKLQALISEPKGWMVQAAWSYCDSVALSTVIEMGIPTLIQPGGKGVTLSYLAGCTNASPTLISEEKLLSPPSAF
ncbi:hypothetical protein McanCB56680_007209 [Microsporum canis]